MTEQKPYTPDEEAVSVAWIEFEASDDDINKADTEFDRFIAQVKRGAWAEGARAMVSGSSTDWVDRENPYETGDQT